MVNDQCLDVEVCEPELLDVEVSAKYVGTGGSRKAVLYVAQKLTEEQQKQARNNIGVVGTGKDGTDGRNGRDGVDATPVWPNFANTTAECTDTAKPYVLPDGYIYAYINGAWVNTGHEFVVFDTLEKVIGACCDVGVTDSIFVYNLLNTNEVSYNSRLQDDVAGVVSSNAQNAVTGWIPVEYGKYYCMSVSWNGVRTVQPVGYQRMNLKRADGTIVVYNKNKVPLATEKGRTAIEILYQDAVSIQLHFALADTGGTTQDIGTQAKLKAFEPMILQGDTAYEASSNATSFAYIDGDGGTPIETVYTLKHDTTKADKKELAALRTEFEEDFSDFSDKFKGQQKITEDGVVIGALFNLDMAQQTGERVNTNSKHGIVTDYIPCSKGDTVKVDTASFTFQVMEYKEKDEPLVYSGVMDFQSTYTVTQDGYICISIRYVDTTKIADKSMISHIVADISGYYDLAKIEKQAMGKVASPYYRNANFGVLPFAYYKGVAPAYEKIFGQTTTYATFIAAWKALVAPHSGYVTEKALGAASDGQQLYSYHFKPASIANKDKPVPKVIIIAGQHGFEKSNIYGLYYFVDNLLNRWTQHTALEYLRNHMELLIVPVANPYGFDTLEYKNANGVNLNRNYNSHWAAVSDPTSSDYGGRAPFDQPETQIIYNVVLSNKDAALVVDFHTNGKESVANYADVNWCAVCESTDSYYNRMKDAIAYHLSAVSANFNLDYALNQPNTMMGHMTNDDGVGLLRNWAYDNNLIGVLVEGFNGFPNDTKYIGKVYKANEEIIVNYLLTSLNYLAQ